MKTKLTRHLLVLLLGVVFSAQLHAQLPNAWQITDDSSAGPSGASYRFTLPPPEQDQALSNGWRYLVNARLVTDFGGGASMVFYYGIGTNRFSIFWDLDSNGDLIATPYGQSNIKLTTNGAGSALYHTHEIRYDPTNAQASYYFDGAVKGTWAGDGVTADNGLVVWGSGSTAGKGQMNFHTTGFFVGSNGVASISYDAGTEGNPVVAPPPEDQAWMPVISSGDAVLPIAPDTTLLPAAATLPASQLTTNGARLNGQTLASGSPTMAWFQWGLDTNYGNVTAPQDVGDGLGGSNVSAMVTGLVSGQNYHFRLVVSNSFGIGLGSNLVFASPGFFPTPLFGSPELRFGAPVWGDYDNDGRVDLVVTVSTNGLLSQVQLWRNTPGGFSNVTAAVLPGVLGENYGSAAWGDPDNDNRLDLLLTKFDSMSVVVELWRNTGTGCTLASTLPGAVLGGLTWGDYDNDGLQDFLLTGLTTSPSNGFTGTSQLWRNTGTGFTNVAIPGLPGVSYSAAAWGDFDQDGRLDFIIAGRTNDDPQVLVSQLWRNTGAGFTNVPIPGLPGIQAYLGLSAVSVADYDNDGRLDFFITGQISNGVVAQIWRNTSSGFSNVTELVAPDLTFVSAVSAVWGDYDNDGWQDFLLTGESTNYNVLAQLWRNTGDGFTNASASIPLGTLGRTYGAAWADYDNDGRLDFAIMTATNAFAFGGELQLWRNNLPGSNAPPSAPAGLSGIVSGDTLTFHWNAAGDDHTPADGLNYNLRIGTTPGGSNIVSGLSLGSGLRLLPQIGNAGPNRSAFYHLPLGWTYYWSVQAIDSSYAGSLFAAEQAVFVPSVLKNLKRFPNGVFQFEFTADPAINVEVRGTTNPALPVASWDNLGLPIPLGDGLYQFNDSLAPIYSQRFYQLVSP